MVVVCGFSPEELVLGCALHTHSAASARAFRRSFGRKGQDGYAGSTNGKDTT